MKDLWGTFFVSLTMSWYEVSDISAPFEAEGPTSVMDNVSLRVQTSSGIVSSSPIWKEKTLPDAVCLNL